jgi:single-stranded-DNA-specific exonuclease
VSKTNPEFLRYLSKKASISTALTQILINRGMKDVDSIKGFLHPSLERLHDPFLMPDMEKAIKRLKTALKRDEVIFIYGDYDADGITSTALLVSLLRRLGLKTYYYIPNRISEGYGLNKTGIQKAKTCGAGLIITADCGISSGEEISEALSQGMDVIITDHHEPPEELPQATAIIDPHRVDSDYPFKYLSGVGVAYKLIQALIQDTGKIQETELEDFLDLVAIGTIADSVPLIGENRIFVTYGLERLNNGPYRVGIQALKEVAGVKKEFRSELLSYTLIPRINAPGRLDDANKVVELFLTEDEKKAKEIADFLEEQNRERQKIEEDVFQSALKMIEPEHLESAIVLSSPEWHLGVIGIVASRLVEMFYRPVFLFSINDSIAKGSARSIPPFHLYKGIAECAKTLLGFGGHRQAAGLKLLTENLPDFKKKINFIVENTLSSDELIPTLKIDAGVRLSEINFNLVKELNLLEPYGDSNEEPILGIKGVEIVDFKIVGNNHLKMKLRQDNITVDTIGFSMGDLLERVETSCFVDIAFIPCINEWNDTKSLQLNLKALRPSM